MDKAEQQHVGSVGPQTLLDERTAAKLLGVSPRVLWGLADSGAIPFIRIGPRLKRYAPEDLNQFINTNRLRSPRGQGRGGHVGMQDSDRHTTK